MPPGGLFALYLVLAGDGALPRRAHPAQRGRRRPVLARAVRRARVGRHRLGLAVAPARARPAARRAARTGARGSQRPIRQILHAAMAAARRLPRGLVRRGRPPRDRRLRRGRARARVRHARLRGRRGRPARPRARVPRRARDPPRRPGEVIFASKAFPCTAVLRVFAEEGLGCRRRLRRRAAPRAARPASRPSGSTCTATRSPRRSCGGASTPASATIVVDNLDDVAKLERVAARPARASACCCASRPGVDADTHAAISPATPTRSSASTRADARALARRPARPPRPRGLPLAHRLPARSTSTPFRAAIEALAGARRPRRLHPRRRPRRRLHARRPAAGDRRRTSARWSRPPHELLGPGKRLVIEPGPRARRQRRRDALHGRVGQAQPSAPVVAVDGGMSDNLRPMLYDAATRPRSPTASARGRAGHGRRQALRVRRRDRPRRTRCPTRSPATSS